MTATARDTPVVVCPGCAGLTFVLAPCDCRSAGDQFLIDWHATLVGDRGPYAGCEQCGGAGTVTAGCHLCHQKGRCRAQLVLTVANVDTPARSPPRR